MIPDSMIEELSRPSSFGLLEGHNGMERGVVDGDDEREIYFEICSKVYGDDYVKVFMSPASNRLDESI
jgi:hypothetical protein